MGLCAYYRPDVSAGAVQYTLLRAPRETRFLVSVQAEANRDHHIVRGQPIPGTLVHGEYLVNLAGDPVTGGHIRDDTIDWQEHRRRVAPRIQNRRLIGFVGAGNLTMNPEFVGFSEQHLFYVGLQRFDHVFPCLISDDLGIRLEHVPCSPDAPPSGDGISGPQLVRDGKPIDLEELAQLAAEGKFYDLRHVLQFPHMSWDPGGSRDAASAISIDIGLERFWRHGGLDPQAVSSAIRGEPVEIALDPYVEPIPIARRAIGLGQLRATLTTQGYVESTRPQVRGDWRFAHDRIEILFYLGIYNHSVLGLGEDSSLRWLGQSSPGGRVGMTLLDTALLAAQSMTDAILVDNGGDVMCQLGDDWLAPSVYGRDKIRGLVFLLGDRDTVRHDSHRVEVRSISEQRLS